METSQKNKSRALRWFGRQAEPIQLEALKLQTDLMRQEKTRGAKHSHELTLSCLADACLKMIFAEEGIGKKGSTTSEELRRVHERRINRVSALSHPGRPSKKYDTIRVKYYYIVKDLRAKDKYGWRNCAKYLLEIHKYQISHNHLKEIMDSLDKFMAENPAIESQNPKEEKTAFSEKAEL